jgi:hypothetical protein
MGQRLVEHKLTLKRQRVQVVRGVSLVCVSALKPHGVSLTAVVDDDCTKMATLEVYLLRAGDEIPAGTGFMAVADGTFLFVREVVPGPASSGPVQ